jgi:hypothetical protein
MCVYIGKIRICMVQCLLILYLRFLLFMMGSAMKFIVICVFLSFFNRIHGQDMQLIAGHVVSLRILRNLNLNYR